MSLDEMRSFITKKMKEMNINEAIANITVNSWRSKKVERVPPSERRQGRNG